MACINRFFPLLVICLFWVTAAPAAELTVNKIAAVVNGEMITLHDLRMHTMAEMARQRLKPNDPKAGAIQKEILNSMINDILMRQEAKRYQLSIPASEVEEEYQNAIKRSGMPVDRFEAGLKTQGITVEMYRKRIEDTLLRRRIANFMVMRKVFVTPEQVAEYYQQNRSQFDGERTADFSMVLLSGKSNAPQIYQQLKAGKISFEAVAQEHSSDRSAQEGGRIRGVPWVNMPPEMQKLLTSLADGGISPLLRTKDGFVVIRRDGIHEAKPLTLQEATPRIEEILKAPLLDERFNEYITQLRGKAVIDIRI